MNKHILINNKHIYYKHYEKQGTSQIKDLLNNNCEFLGHLALNQRYKLNISFMDIIQLKSSIPSEWKEKFKQCISLPQHIPSVNLIKAGIANHSNSSQAKTGSTRTAGVLPSKVGSV